MLKCGFGFYFSFFWFYFGVIYMSLSGHHRASIAVDVQSRKTVVHRPLNRITKHSC